MARSACEMDVFETILARRSVHRYAKQPIDQATLGTLLEAAVRAPTAMDREPWAFVIIQDRPFLDELSRKHSGMAHRRVSAAGVGGGNMLEGLNGEDIFYEAGTLIAIFGPSSLPCVEADCWMAAGNLMLAACAMGLGSSVIGEVIPVLNLPLVKAHLRVPVNYTAIAPIVVGYAVESRRTGKRNPPLVLCHLTGIPASGP